MKSLEEFIESGVSGRWPEGEKVKRKVVSPFRLVMFNVIFSQNARVSVAYWALRC